MILHVIVNIRWKKLDTGSEEYGRQKSFIICNVIHRHSLSDIDHSSFVTMTLRKLWKNCFMFCTSITSMKLQINRQWDGHKRKTIVYETFRFYRPRDESIILWRIIIFTSSSNVPIILLFHDARYNNCYSSKRTESKVISDHVFRLHRTINGFIFKDNNFDSEYFLEEWIKRKIPMTWWFC